MSIGALLASCLLSAALAADSEPTAPLEATPVETTAETPSPEAQAALKAAEAASRELEADAPPPAPLPEALNKPSVPTGVVSCVNCHSLMRDRRPRALLPEAPPLDRGSYDAVVIGGGPAALAAAYGLRPLKVLILDEKGGMPGLAPGMPFAFPEAAPRLQELLRSLRLKPRKLDRVTDALADKGKVVADWLAGDPARLPLTAGGQGRFKKLQADMRELAASKRLTLPIEACGLTAIEEADAFTFFQWLDNRYGPEVSRLGDLFSRRVFGAGANEVSAAAGLILLSREVAASQGIDGGADAVLDPLIKDAGPHLSTGAFAWRVTQGFDRATVDFYQDGFDHTVSGRAVIFTLPAFLYSRILPNMKEERKEAASQARYSAYAALPVVVSTAISANRLWTPDRAFVQLSRGHSGALRAHLPLGTGDERRRLQNAPDSEYADRVTSDLTAVLGGGLDASLGDLERWGHAMTLPFPGFLTKVRPDLAKPDGRVFFAGQDTQLPGFEAELLSGLRAAEEARIFLRVK